MSLSRKGLAAGMNHPNWRGGRIIQRGYVYLHRPSHPQASLLGYVAEHRLVMESILGRQLLSVEVVHHLNGIKGDNRRENLALCNNASAHVAIHSGEIFLPI
jgi:hypothetical protein